MLTYGLRRTCATLIIESAVSKGAFALAELTADVVGHPTAVEVFVKRRAKTVLRSRAVGFTQEVVRVARVNVDRAGLVREVKARTEPDARDEVLVVVLLDLHAVRSRGVVTLREAIGDFDLRLDIGAFHELEGAVPFDAQAEGVRIKVDVHVAGLDVVLDVAVDIAVVEVVARIGVAEGAAHDPVVHADIGVLPLALVNSRIAIGTGTLSGTLSSTLLSLFFVPVFFLTVGKTKFRADSTTFHRKAEEPPFGEKSEEKFFQGEIPS